MVAPMLQPVRELLEPRSQGYETLNDGKKEKSKWKYYKPFIVTGIVGFATACTLFVDSLGKSFQINMKPLETGFNVKKNPNHFFPRSGLSSKTFLVKRNKKTKKQR